MSVRLLDAVIATTSAPTLANQGASLRGDQPGYVPGYWLGAWDAGVIHVKGAGTGALTFQGIVWLYSVLTGVWEPAGMDATIADRGKLNDGNTITGTTTLAHTQPISGLSAYNRIALQATTLTGTDMVVSAFMSPRFV